MYPDLSYFFNDIFGTALDNGSSIIKTFGLLLALAFGGSSLVLRSELKRYEKEGKLHPIKKKIKLVTGFQWSELIINVIVTFIVGGKLPMIVSRFSEFKGDPASLLFSKEGKWSIGILAAVVYAVYYYVKNKDIKSTATEQLVSIHPYKRSGDITIVAAISGVAGARFFSILENLDGFASDPIGTIFSGSGLTVYGGLIVGIAVGYIYVKRMGIKPIHMLDICGMAILVGYGIGRMGCQFSGDGDWGIVAAAQPEWWFLPDWMWAYEYPNNVNNVNALVEGCDPAKYNEVLRQPGMGREDACMAACGYRYCHELQDPVYPTPIYEIIYAFSAFAILWVLRKRIKIAGILACLYLIFTGAERFLIEKIRVNDKYNYFGQDWSQAQYISIIFVLVGVGGIIYLWRKHKRSIAA